MQYTKIRGVIVPLLTPFDPQGRIDEAAAARLVDYLIARGVKGLFPGGTTGEGPLLTGAERRRLAEVVVGAAGGRVPVIVHTGAATTREAVALTRHAQRIGAQAAALITPYYYRYPEEALFRHFAHIAAQTPDFPLYLYNFPAVTGNALSVDLVARLVEHCPNIVGLKDSSGALDLLVASLSWRGGAFNPANGSDGLLLAALALGLEACVSGNANVVPELVVALYDAMARGDLATARALQAKLDRARAILSDGADLSLFKGLLARRGLPVGEVRSPLLPASEAKLAACWEALAALGVELGPVA